MKPIKKVIRGMMVATIICVATAPSSLWAVTVSGDDAKGAVAGWVQLR